MEELTENELKDMKLRMRIQDIIKHFFYYPNDTESDASTLRHIIEDRILQAIKERYKEEN